MTRVILLRGYGCQSAERRLMAYLCRRNSCRVQPALQFDIPIYKPE